MSYAESSDVAWDLVEHGRATMNIAELNAAFVRLGVGEDREAIEIALKSMCRAAGPRLPDELLARLTRLAQVGFFNRHVMDLLAVVSRAGTHYSPVVQSSGQHGGARGHGARASGQSR